MSHMKTLCYVQHATHALHAKHRKLMLNKKMNAILQPANIEILAVDFKDGYSRDYYRMGDQYLVSGIIKSCDDTGPATYIPVRFIPFNL